MPDRDVIAQRRRQHVRVHVRSAGKQSLEAFHANRQRDWKPHRRPQRIAAADPIPHRQDPRLVDAEVRGALHIRADRIHAAVVLQPVADHGAVEQRFLRSKSL